MCLANIKIDGSYFSVSSRPSLQYSQDAYAAQIALAGELVDDLGDRLSDVLSFKGRSIDWYLDDTDRYQESVLSLSPVGDFFMSISRQKDRLRLRINQAGLFTKALPQGLGLDIEIDMHSGTVEEVIGFAGTAQDLERFTNLFETLLYHLHDLMPELSGTTQIKSKKEPKWQLQHVKVGEYREELLHKLIQMALGGSETIDMICAVANYQPSQRHSTVGAQDGANLPVSRRPVAAAPYMALDL